MYNSFLHDNHESNNNLLFRDPLFTVSLGNSSQLDVRYRIGSADRHNKYCEMIIITISSRPDAESVGEREDDGEDEREDRSEDEREDQIEDERVNESEEEEERGCEMENEHRDSVDQYR